MSSCSKVLVVGGGLTSAVTAHKLAESLSQGSVTVWDKARGAGGRMTTSRSPGNPQCKVDLGAQYVSASPANQKLHEVFYQDLVSSGTLVHFDTQGITGFRQGEPGTKHYYAPDGMASIVKHFFKRSGVDVEFNQRITDVSKSDGKWTVKTEKGLEDSFDAVVLTLPVPQVLDLEGDISTIIRGETNLLNKLQKVEYSTRFALGFFYDKPVDLGVNWTSNYVSNHPIFRFVAIDNLKRGDKNGPTSVIAHTSVPFGIKHIEDTPDSMKSALTSSLQELFPEWPQPPNVKCLKWKFSQVSKSYEGSPGSLVISKDPPLILAGDGFAATSNFDGCLHSAVNAANNVVKAFQ